MLAFPEDAIVERLRSCSALKQIGLAPDLAAAMETPPRSGPAVFVSFATTGQQSDFSGEQVQGARVTAVQLVLWVRNAGSAERVLAERRVVSEAVDACLSGWSPSDAVEALFQIGLRDQFIHGAWLVSQMVYRAPWLYSGVVQ